MATANTSGPIYCGTGVDNFHTSYRQYHGYVSLIVCILGTIANTLNIIVLTRREMRSPTNAILTGLAVADLAVMIEYIPYSLHDYILGEHVPLEERLSYGWACFIQFHSIFAQVLHTISIWLTVTLAVWRYIAVGYPQKNRVWCGMRTTIITITMAYVVCVLVVSPSLYIIFAIIPFHETLDANGNSITRIRLGPNGLPYTPVQPNNITQSANAEAADVATVTASLGNGGDGASASAHTALLNATMSTYTLIMNAAAGATTTESSANGSSHAYIADTSSPLLLDATPTYYTRNVTVYRVNYSELAQRNSALRTTIFLIYSVLIKLIPCIALTILSVRLIAALLEAKRRRKMLTSNAANGMKPLVNGKPVAVERPRKNSKTLEKEKQTDRTTRMLLAVLLLFLITEFPQGIMGLLNSIFGDPFFMQCYLKLSDLMDILALLNSSINFILYCSMSRQFRTTFTLLFRPKFLDKWLPVAQHDDANMTNGGSGVGLGAGGGGGGGGGCVGGGGGRLSRCRTDALSRSAIAIDQQGTMTQVTNV